MTNENLLSPTPIVPYSSCELGIRNKEGRSFALARASVVIIKLSKTTNKHKEVTRLISGFAREGIY